MEILEDLFYSSRAFTTAGFGLSSKQLIFCYDYWIAPIACHHITEREGRQHMETQNMVSERPQIVWTTDR